MYQKLRGAYARVRTWPLAGPAASRLVWAAKGALGRPVRVAAPPAHPPRPRRAPPPGTDTRLVIALTRPAFLYLFLVTGAVALIAAAMRRHRRGALAAAAFLFAGVVVIAPWVVRNAVVMHDVALTAGYGPHVLNERIAFDQMSWHEYGLSFLCWLPDGNGMGSLLFGHDACRRFQLDLGPDTFYGVGNGALMQQSLAASGGWAHMTGYLLRSYILPHPVKHALVTLSLALRGLWLSHYWGFVLAPICLVITVKAWRRRDLPFLAISLPAWFMLLFAAAISVNQTRYNLMLILPFAVSGAVAVEAVIERRRATSAASSDPAPG